MLFHFDCPQCGLTMQASVESGGGAVECPGCGKQFVVEAPVPEVTVVQARPVAAPNRGQARQAPGRSAHATPAARPQPPAPKPPKENRMPYYALGGTGILLVGVVFWLNSRIKPKIEPAPPAPEPSALSASVERAKAAAAAEDPEKARMDAELKRIKTALADKETADQLKARDEYRQLAAKEEEKLEELRSYLSENFFAGDDAAVEVCLNVWRDVLFEAAHLEDEDTPGHVLKNREEFEAYVNMRMLARFQKDPVLSQWLKDHQRDPAKFVQELLQTKSKRQVPKTPGSSFDFKKYVSVGSGFWISADGWILTNEHVVSDSKVVDLRLRDGKVVQANVIKTDEANDLALIKADLAPESWLAVSKGATDLQLGRTVFTVGYPDPVVQGVEPKFTDGRISAASGISDRKDSYQTTVPVQHGNSGGALVDFATGWVVGVINAKLENRNGVSADNVSYAIKGSVVSTFFETVPEAKAAALKAPPKPVTKGSEREVIDRATESSVLILRPRA
jgi:S1-C subfamily serine protease